jgi:hypothetical protein
MQYIFLLLAFLAECTLRPAYVNTTLTVEIIIITYFIIILQTKHSIPVWIPAILVLISNFIRNEMLGLQSLILMVAALACYYMFIKNQHKVKINIHGTKIPLTNNMAIGAFAVSFFIFTLLQAFVSQIFGHNASLFSEMLYYTLNVFVFIIITLCI